MRFLIVPGAADPKHFYTDVYDLVCQEASKRNYSTCQLISYQGHYSFDNESYLSIHKVAQGLIELLDEYEQVGEDYIILSRSFGCMPLIECLKIYSNKLAHLKKVVFWGASPFYLWYKYLKIAFDEEQFKEKNVRVDSSLFNEVYPFELSLIEVPKNINYEIHVTSGALDDDYPESFHITLKELNKNFKINFRDRIPNIGHAVKEPNEEYFNLIFNF